MNGPRNITVAVVAAGTLAAGLLTGCATAAQVGGTATVSKTKLQSMAKEKLEAAAHAKARSVACEGGIESKMGATQRCVLTDSKGTKWSVTATVTAVKDDNNTHIDFRSTTPRRSDAQAERG
jgi:hypothetical protein